MDKIDEIPLKKSEQLRGPLGIRIVISLLVLFITIGIFLIGWGVQHREKPESICELVESANNTNKTQAVIQKLPFTPKRSAEPQKEMLEILIPRGKAVTVSLDVCDVVVCGDLHDKTGHDVYGCIHAWGRPDDNSWCPSSEKVYWSARAQGNNDPPGLAFRSQLSFSKGRHSGDMSKHNPIIIAFKSELTPVFKKKGDVTAFHLLIGIEVPGKDPMGSILVKIIEPQADVISDLAPHTESFLQPKPEVPPAKSENNPLVTYLSTTSIQKAMAVETGYEDTNSWLDWVVYSVKQSNMADCLACAAARPSLGTVPFPFNAHNNPRGQICMYKLYGQKSPADCVDISQKYPVVNNNDIPPAFTSYEGLYDCITRNCLKGTEVGTLKWCNSTKVVMNQEFLPGIAIPITQFPRADVWWYCGTKTLYPVLPQDWTGTCAMVQLVMPFYAVPMTAEQLIRMALQPKATRAKRSAPRGSFDSTVYMDSIGVPMGVPDEFKARNQIFAGLESIFLWPTVNKNVDWINYIYYNQQRFINHSLDALRGLHEQLDKTSIMSLQNRMALDMILAEKGGVCEIFGTLCCTFIPNNTSPDGSVTKALKGLAVLSREMADNSGIGQNPLGDFFDGLLGKYKNLVLSGLMSISGVVVILALCCCCCSTCIRTFANRLVNGALNQEYTRGQYLMRGPFQILAEQDNPPPYTDVDENDEFV